MMVMARFWTSSGGANPRVPQGILNGYLAMRSGSERLPNLFLLLGIMLKGGEIPLPLMPLISITYTY
jgi:hypothetical protein